MLFRKKREPKHKKDEPKRKKDPRKPPESDDPQRPPKGPGSGSLGRPGPPQHARWYHVVDLIDWVGDTTDWSR
jgi:hypothetical protein